jgi:hypothetical protein
MNTIPPAKTTRRSMKSDRHAAKKPRAASKKDASAPQRDPAPDENTPSHSNETVENAQGLDESRLHVPTFLHVELKPPRYTGRILRNPDDALERAERRLKIAWLFHHELDPALPGGEGFHAVAWTALNVIRQHRRALSASAASRVRKAALEALVARLSIVRGVVEDTTRPGAPERATLHFEVALQPTSALLKVAPEILKGATSLTARFPALTTRVLTKAQEALETAQKAHAAAIVTEETRTLARVATADQVQLAIDVLHDGIDHLRSAARAVFLPEREVAAGYFLEALEPVTASAKGGDEEAAPDATKPDATKPDA